MARHDPCNRTRQGVPVHVGLHAGARHLSPPRPAAVRCVVSRGEDSSATAQDVLNLTRMNWNTADIRGKWPLSLSFARRAGDILDEYGDDDLTETSSRYFV